MGKFNMRSSINFDLSIAPLPVSVMAACRDRPGGFQALKRLPGLDPELIGSQVLRRCGSAAD
jgi:hypothetical protein